MLCFEITSDGIQIDCDQEGMEIIIKAFERVKADGDHIHLRSSAYGGTDLSDKTLWDRPAVGMVTITWYGDRPES